ncbi:MAG: MFS transporter [Verrucomicrobia bacterium]|nr:MFS transporter [Verrucomicrobiota bacterium]
MQGTARLHLRTSILFFLVSFGSVCGVLVTPALPKIQQFFHISEGAAQLVITAYLLGYALGQLPYGPLANGIGRKKTLYVGMAVAMLGSLLCAISAPLGWFKLLIIARFIQALGACVGLKVSYTMVADVYDQVTATRKISKMIVAFAVMPGLAVAIGGWLTQTFGWQSCFYFLAVFGVIVSSMITAVPETASRIHLDALKINVMIKDYSAKFRNKPLVLAGLIMGSGTSVVYLYSAKAPFIGIDVIGMQPDTFGMFNLLPSLGMLIGIAVAAHFAGYQKLLRLMKLATIFCLGATLTMLVPFAFFGPSIWSLFFPMILVYTAEALVFANTSSLGLSQAKNKAHASAVLNFLNIIFSFFVVLLSGYVFSASALAMPIAFMCFFVAMLWLLHGLQKSLQK